MFCKIVSICTSVLALSSSALSMPVTTFKNSTLSFPAVQKNLTISANVIGISESGDITSNTTQTFLHNTTEPVTRYQRLAASTVYRPTIGYFAGFNIGAYTASGACKAPQDWVNEMRKIKSWSNSNFAWHTVKIFTTSECSALANAVAAAKTIGGMRVWAGIWASPYDKYTAEKAALEAQILAGNSYWIVGVSVGSEEMYRGMAASTLSGYIWDVKGMVQNAYGCTATPIGTSDSINTLRNSANSAVLAAVDIAMVTDYPYYGGSNINSALSAFKNDWWSLGAMMEGRPLIVGETGWPSSGPTIGQAVANLANAQQFFKQVSCWMRATKKAFFYFEATDELWKTDNAAESAFGVSWSSGSAAKFALSC